LPQYRSPSPYKGNYPELLNQVDQSLERLGSKNFNGGSIASRSSFSRISKTNHTQLPEKPSVRQYSAQTHQLPSSVNPDFSKPTLWQREWLWYLFASPPNRPIKKTYPDIGCPMIGINSMNSQGAAVLSFAVEPDT
jgi:hypothetical protein